MSPLGKALQSWLQSQCIASSTSAILFAPEKTEYSVLLSQKKNKAHTYYLFMCNFTDANGTL